MLGLLEQIFQVGFRRAWIFEEATSRKHKNGAISIATQHNVTTNNKAAQQDGVVQGMLIWSWRREIDGYYMANNLITLLCIFFMFIEIKFIHCHSCVMFAMKSMSMCNE